MNIPSALQHVSEHGTSQVSTYAQQQSKVILEIADILLSDDFPLVLNRYLKEGITFASARQKACEELGCKTGILDKPNYKYSKK